MTKVVQKKKSSKAANGNKQTVSARVQRDRACALEILTYSAEAGEQGLRAVTQMQTALAELAKTGRKPADLKKFYEHLTVAGASFAVADMWLKRLDDSTREDRRG